MPLPRQVLPGKSYFITRSCKSRRFFACPTDTLVNHIFMYCIAFAASLSGVEIHAVCIMSSHVHLVVTDVEGRLPIFTQWLFRHTSCCLKTLRDIPENVWTVQREEPVELLTEEAFLDAIAYVMSNPSSAFLVRKSRSWPGLVTGPVELRGTEVVVEPPPVYFRKSAKPAVYRITPPEVLLADRTVEQLVDAVGDVVEHYEREALRELRDSGGTVVGLKRLARTDPFDQPSTPRKTVDEKVNPNDPNQGRVPRFKARCAQILKEARKRLKAFWVAYYDALEEYRQTGQTVFPAGTWWYPTYLNLPVSPPE